MVVGISHFIVTQARAVFTNVFERISPKILIFQDLIFCRFHAKVKICLFLPFKCGYFSRIRYIFFCQQTIFTTISGKNIYPSFVLKIGTNGICRDPAEQQ